MYGSFSSLDELWQGSLEYVLKFGKTHDGRKTWGKKGARTKEVLGPVLRLTNIYANLLCHAGRLASPIYAAGEFLWYLNPDSPGDQICYYAPSYKRFIEPEGHAHGGYGRRIRMDNQLFKIIGLLRAQPETRQAIMSIWRPHLDIGPTLAGTKLDIPCTIALQFLVRDGQLNCICTMRSNDIWLGLPYDIFCWTTLQHIIAGAVGIPVGFYQHQAGSLHLYERDWKKAQEAAGIGASPLNFHFEDDVDEYYAESIVEAKRIEQELRKLDILNEGCFRLIKNKFGAGSRWGFLLALCLLNSSDDLSKESLEMANVLIPEIPLTMALVIRKQRAEREAAK